MLISECYNSFLEFTCIIELCVMRGIKAASVSMGWCVVCVARLFIITYYPQIHVVLIIP
jgi:hypothetical protein